LLVVVNESGL